MMPSIAAVVVGGLTWQYCSNRCLQRRVRELIVEVEAEIRNCPDCLIRNEELLEVLDGAEEPDLSIVGAENSTMVVKEHSPIVINSSNNAFFNFLQVYRRENVGQRQSSVARAAAAEWNIMTEEQKKLYQKNHK